jgi:hypothetical protein
MEYAKLETAALVHLDDSYYYGSYCRKCKHSARLSLAKLRAQLGDGFPLVKVKDRLGSGVSYPPLHWGGIARKLQYTYDVYWSSS